MTSFWIVNAIGVTTSDERLIRELAARPDVDSIKADESWPAPQPLPGEEEPKIQSVEWGVARVRAPEVWDQFRVRGEGIVVANIDTGVQFDHPALAAQYRGRQSDGSLDHNYNWYDPLGACPDSGPCDTNGHGTHTMGTMAGDDSGFNQIGVAPRARWIAAKACDDSCSTTALLLAGQWILAPTDLKNENPRPDLRPHVVNSSWGRGTTDLFYRVVVQNWRNAGIFPAFASGNEGRCGAANSPGAYPESFSVGAIDITDTITEFSGRGPAAGFEDIVKPNVVAPGRNVRSSVPPNNYASFTGTSMATPHVAGIVALLWSSRPALVGDVTTTFDVLQRQARFYPDTGCGPAGPPNNGYGWGIVDAFASVQQIFSGGTLAGQITDSSGVPVPGARVHAVGPVDRTAIAGPDGGYQLALASGIYTLTATAFGYALRTVTGIQINESATTTRDFSLDSVPVHQVSGAILSSVNGRPLVNVEVTLADTPLAPVLTDSAGTYSFPEVPEGTYDLKATPPSTLRCFLRRTQSVTVSQDAVVDLALDPKTDSFGYACDDTAVFTWVEGSDLLPLGGRDQSIPVTLPFAFTFYGQTYDTVYVATNGFVNFLGPNAEYNNFCIPNPSFPPKALIAPMWIALDVNPPAGIWTGTQGVAPNRQFTVEWRDVPFYCYPCDGTVTFEMILDEASGSITMQYNRIDGYGVELATVGVENESGTVALQYACGGAPLSAGKAIKLFLNQ